MFIFKIFRIFRKAIFILAIIGAIVVAAVFGGCGAYVAHEPDLPAINRPGEPEEPGEETPGESEEPEPTPPEEGATYTDGHIVVIDSLFEPVLYGYAGEINAVQIEVNIFEKASILITPADETIGEEEINLTAAEYAAGTELRLTVKSSGPQDCEWSYVNFSESGETLAIELIDGQAEFAAPFNGVIWCNIENTDGVLNQKAELTITLEAL